MSDPSSYLGWKIDYAHPPGERALLEPGSMHWRVYKNPVALAVGGVAAVLLEFADPRIRSGVWDHSTFKTDPAGRARRTGTAALIGVYGPASAARRVIQGVNNMHARVVGETPAGEPYRALDVDLLDWVAATAAFGFLNAFDRFVEPLTEAEKTRFYAEAQTLARLYGAESPPASEAEFMAMTEARAPRFEPHPIVEAFLEIVQTGRLETRAPRFLHKTLAQAAVSLLPTAVQSRLALGPAHDLPRLDSLALKAAGALADRIPLLSAPPCQASARLGLPSDVLYRRRAERQRLLEGWTQSVDPGLG